MNRIGWGHDSISRGWQLLPEGMRQRLSGVDFLTGVDPRFAGLLPSNGWFSEHPYQAGAQVEAACCYPHHTLDRSLTIVVVKPLPYDHSIVHELGHALQWQAGLQGHVALPVTPYATNSRWEAFAESLVSWTYHHDHLRTIDPETVALFDQLAEPIL